MSSNSSRLRRAIALTTILTAQLMLTMDFLIVLVALPKIQTELGFTSAGLSWVPNAFALAFGGLLLAGGRLGDIYGQVKAFKIGIAVVNVFGPIRVTQAFLPLLKKAAGARVVMMSSGLGSLGLVTDPTSIYSTASLLAYNSSKTALNAVSVAFAKELAPFGIKVNAVEPGSVATDLNGNNGALTPDEGAASAIRLATIGVDGPTGGFFGHDGTQPW